MRESHSALLTESHSALTIDKAVARWLDDGRAEGHSAKTRFNRADMLARFVWWVEHIDGMASTIDALTPDVVRRFLGYLRDDHPEGRWGSKRASAARPLSPASINRFFREIRSLSRWLQAEGLLDGSAVKNIKAPKLPKGSIPPPADEEVLAIHRAARETGSPERNAALIAVLVDTGARAGEVAAMCVGDVDRGEGCISVLGKGGKRRQVALGGSARRLVWQYLATVGGARLEDPLWTARSGRTPGAALTTSGIFQIVRDCGRRAGLSGIGPHDLRRFAAVSMLKSGMDVLTLQRVLGHESLSVLRIYVELAETDIQGAHRKASPADRLRLR